MVRRTMGPKFDDNVQQVTGVCDFVRRQRSSVPPHESNSKIPAEPVQWWREMGQEQENARTVNGQTRSGVNGSSPLKLDSCHQTVTKGEDENRGTSVGIYHCLL